jgi:hypothetical protein
LHHWNIYECDSDYENIYLKNNTEPIPSISENLDSSLPYNPQWNTVFKFCSKISWVWAKGGELALDFPDDLAYPIGRHFASLFFFKILILQKLFVKLIKGGPQGDFKYMVLETHYNNPSLLKSVF